jgi:hypothetical protein
MKTPSSPRTNYLDDGPEHHQRDHPYQLPSPNNGAEVEDRLPLNLPAPYYIGANRLGV